MGGRSLEAPDENDPSSRKSASKMRAAAAEVGKIQYVFDLVEPTAGIEPATC